VSAKPKPVFELAFASRWELTRSAIVLVPQKERIDVVLTEMYRSGLSLEVFICCGTKHFQASVRTCDLILNSSESKRWDSRSEMDIRTHLRDHKVNIFSGYHNLYSKAIRSDKLEIWNRDNR